MSRRWRTVGLCVAVPAMTGCIHYDAKLIAPAQPLATIEARSTADEHLRTFLTQHGVVATAPAQWDLRSWMLLAFYFHPALDEARAAAASRRAASRRRGRGRTAVPTVDPLRLQ